MASFIEENDNVLGQERQDIAEAINDFLEDNWEKYFKSRYLMKCLKGEIMNIIFDKGYNE